MVRSWNKVIVYMSVECFAFLAPKITKWS